jgi:predicted permease
MPMAEAQQHSVIRSILVLLSTAVAAMLLIVLANVGSLLLVRIRARRGELAVRASLGAGRGQLLRQLIVEGNLLALTGGLLGLVFGYGGATLLANLRPSLPESFVLMRGSDLLAGASLAPDLTVLAVAFLLMLVVGTSMGLITAAGATRDSVTDALRMGSRTHTMRTNGRAVLVVGQIALAASLLFGAGLTLRSFNALIRADVGFNAEPVLTVKLARSRFDTRIAGPQRAHLLQQLAGLPGVSGVASATTTPFEAEGIPVGPVTVIDGRQVGETELPPLEFHSVSADYFGVLGIPLHAGRGFDATRDGLQEVRPVLINQAAARTLWPGVEPLGRTFGRPDDLARVIGVVGDARYQRLQNEASPAVYRLGGDGTEATLFIRTRGNPASFIEPVRRVVAAAEPGTAVFDESTLRQRIHEAASDTRYVTLLLIAFGALAALLAAIGVYGVLAYSVQARRNEFGVRMAVGARPGELVSGVMREGLRLLAIGLVIGLLLALASAGVLRAFLYEIQPTDRPTLAGVILMVSAVAVIATLLPALRAGRVDPMVVLRE